MPAPAAAPPPFTVWMALEVWRAVPVRVLGSLQLPPELFEEFPPGTLLEVRRDGAEITLLPRSEEPPTSHSEESS